MKKLIKLLSALLAVLLIFSLCGCGAVEPQGEQIDYANDPPPEQVENPPTLAEFLSTEIEDFAWDAEAYSGQDPNGLFELELYRARRMQNGVFAILKDTENMEDIIQYVRLDGTGRLNLLTKPWTDPRGGSLGMSTLYCNKDLAMLYVDAYHDQNFMQLNMWYFYEPTLEVKEIEVLIPHKGLTKYGRDFMPLTNTDFLWYEETAEHYELRTELGLGILGAEELFLVPENCGIPSVDYYMYSLLTDKSYYLAPSTPDIFFRDGGINEPMFDTWMENYREQRDKDIAAMG